MIIGGMQPIGKLKEGYDPCLQSTGMFIRRPLHTISNTVSDRMVMLAGDVLNLCTLMMFWLLSRRWLSSPPTALALKPIKYPGLHLHSVKEDALLLFTLCLGQLEHAPYTGLGNSPGRHDVHPVEPGRLDNPIWQRVHVAREEAPRAVEYCALAHCRQLL